VKVGGVEQSGRLEVGGDLHDLVVGPLEARSLIGGARSLRRPSRGHLLGRTLAQMVLPDGLDGADHRGVEQA
jgi:hypothetical protein